MYNAPYKKGFLQKQNLGRRTYRQVQHCNRVLAQPRSGGYGARRQFPTFTFTRRSLPKNPFNLPKLYVGEIFLRLLFTTIAVVTFLLNLLIFKNPLLIALGEAFWELVQRIKAIPVPDPVSPEARAMRLTFVAAGLCLALIGVVARLVFLQSSEQQKWAQLSSRQYSASVEVEGARGEIVDSQGRLLATSIPTVSVGAHPRQISDKQSVAARLAEGLSMPKEEILEQLNRDTSFVWLARGLSKNAQATVESLKSRAVNVYPSFRRFYPQGELASPIIGRVSLSGSGQAGVERIFDKVLQAEATQREVRRDARGRLMDSQPSGNSSIVTASQRQEGASVKLTIDSFAQKILEEEVIAGQAEFKAKDIFAVVMDAENGAVLAMAQTKGFDPNAANGVTPEQLKNMVAEVSFEPGSTMKPLVAAFALQSGIASAEQKMDCEASGRYRVGRHTVRDAHPVGFVDFPQIIIQSSNICMAKMAEKMGANALHGLLTSMGFGEATGLELPGEARGILRPLKDWKTIDVATHSFGQGIAATSIQLVRAYGILANGGYLVTPTLLGDKANRGERKQIFRPEIVAQMNDMLRRVVEDKEGTGKRAAIPGMVVYGKTGTAQKANPAGRGYLPDAVLASFIGFVKGQELGLDRSLVMLVAVDEPGVKPRWGGLVAAPVFQKSMERIVSYLLTIESDVRTAAALKSTPKADA